MAIQYQLNRMEKASYYIRNIKTLKVALAP